MTQSVITKIDPQIIVTNMLLGTIATLLIIIAKIHVTRASPVNIVKMTDDINHVDKELTIALRQI